MKRVIGIFILALCVTVPVFSQLRMNGWGRAVWIPVFLDAQSEAWKSTVQSSYGDEPDFEFQFSASSANVGVDVGVLVQAQQFNQIGNAKVWWRPNEYFKLHVGLGRVPTLRGKVEGSTGAYSYARGRVTNSTVPSGKDEPILMVNDGDGIFSRFNLSKMGAIMEITPIEGLFLGAAFAPEFTLNSGLDAKDVYSGLHVAAGYEIKDIGLFRFGYIGGGSTDPQGKLGNAGQNWDFSYDRRIEAAFAFTMVQDLIIDVGFKLSREEHPGILDQPGFSLENPLYFALGVMYTGLDKLKIGFAADGHFAGKAKINLDENGVVKNDDPGDPVTSAPQIAFNIYPSYDVGFCEIGADFTFGMQLGDEVAKNDAGAVLSRNDKKMLGFGVYGHKQYGHGNFRLGVYANAPMNKGQHWGMSIPVWITYSF